MKNLFSLCLVMLTAITFSFSAHAQEGESEGVTHEELADLVLNLTGLQADLPPNPSDQETFKTLLLNGIAPAEGWVPGEAVTRGDLARVIVQALGLVGEVDDPDNNESYVAYLVSIGVSIDSVGQAVNVIEPIVNPVSPNVDYAATTDPLKKPQDTSGRLPDANFFGADANNPAPLSISIAEIEQIIVEVTNPTPAQNPVTPF